MPLDLPPTFEKQNINDELQPFNTRISFGSSERLSSILRTDTPLIVRSAAGVIAEQRRLNSTTIFQKSRDTLNSITTQDDPAILVEYGASFCSLLIAVDENGNAITRHDPMTYDEEEAIDEKLNSFFSGAVNVVSPDNSVVILTGTNSQDGQDTYQKKILNRIKENSIRVGNFKRNQKVITSFVKPVESAYVEARSKVEALRRKAIKIAHKLKLTRNSDAGFPPTTREVSGVILVPSQLSSTGITEVLFLSHESDLKNIQETLFPQSQNSDP